MNATLPRLGSVNLVPETTAEQRVAAMEAKFANLVHAWKSAALTSSSIEKLAVHPAYQQIIGMGPDALPMLLREMDASPNHWSWALRAITGENPVQPSSRGNLKAMAADWLAWANGKGLKW